MAGFPLGSCHVNNHANCASFGVELHAGNEHRHDARCAMIVVDLRCRCIVRIIDLEDVVRNEPEDAAFWDERLLLFCGQTGGIHRVKK